MRFRVYDFIVWRFSPGYGPRAAVSCHPDWVKAPKNCLCMSHRSGDFVSACNGYGPGNGTGLKPGRVVSLSSVALQTGCRLCIVWRGGLKSRTSLIALHWKCISETAGDQRWKLWKKNENVNINSHSHSQFKFALFTLLLTILSHFLVSYLQDIAISVTQHQPNNHRDVNNLIVCLCVWMLACFAIKSSLISNSCKI